MKVKGPMADKKAPTANKTVREGRGPQTGPSYSNGTI